MVVLSDFSNLALNRYHVWRNNALTCREYPTDLCDFDNLDEVEKYVANRVRSDRTTEQKSFLSVDDIFSSIGLCHLVYSLDLDLRRGDLAHVDAKAFVNTFITHEPKVIGDMDVRRRLGINTLQISER